jgi:hypothetical protein
LAVFDAATALQGKPRLLPRYDVLCCATLCGRTTNVSKQKRKQHMFTMPPLQGKHLRLTSV